MTAPTLHELNLSYAACLGALLNRAQLAVGALCRGEDTREHTQWIVKLAIHLEWKELEENATLLRQLEDSVTLKQNPCGHLGATESQ